MSVATRLARHWVVIALYLALVPVAVAQEGGEQCVDCHEGVPVSSPAHPQEDIACVDCHVNVPEDHAETELAPLPGDEACGDCHRRPHRDVGRSIHDGKAGCVDCHGDPHTMHLVEDRASAVSPANQIQSCGECHDDPPDVVEGFLTSVHGRGLLRAGLAASASCSDCHGAHSVLAADDPEAPTAREHSPEMCGTCHTLLLDDWTNMSAHGDAWQAGNTEAPVCTDCHSSHGVADPTTDGNRLASAETCGDCHAEYLTTFRDSFHGKAGDLGFVQGATCSDCHTPHKNLAQDDPRSSVHPDNLVETCSECHEGVTASFVTFDPHNDPSDPDDNYAVYITYKFMMALLIGVFSFFAVHDLLWLQRGLVGSLRGEFREEAGANGQYVRRFPRKYIWLHIVIIVTFLLLALTGLPLKFHDTEWAQTLIGFLGGVESSKFIHHLAGLGTFGYAIFHLADLFVRWAFKRERGMFWGENSMVPQPRDIVDIFANLRYFLYLGKRPGSDRWNYIEKFDYLAVFWGVMIIGISGLILWFPSFFARVLPGWTVNVAYVIHSDEALLATGFIFVFHFFHTHLRPESFPMDTVIFTGKLSLERFKAERPLEYERLVESGELESYLVDPPTRDEQRTAYIWGTIFLTIGVALAIGIIWALIVH
jgi:cytochrome b subunit of formate dehydrogenase